MQVTATFVINSWDEQPYDEQEGAKLTRARVTKTFAGEVEGTSTAELLLAYAQDGSAAYVGLERFSGRVHGLAGSFVLQHSATMTRLAHVESLLVVPDSGMGEVAGLVGRAQVVRAPDGGHSFTLEYDFEEPEHA
jgi:hypothetical protein